MGWTQQMVTTARGKFELYVKGEGAPLCISHLYAEFSDSANNFAEPFVKHRKVFLVNLKNSGKSSKAKHARELSMNETVKDLESIREVLGFERWGYAGHSTGGFLGLHYAIQKTTSVNLLVLSGTAASNDFLKSDHCLYNFKGNYGKDYFKIFIILALPFSRKKKLAANRKWIELSLYHPERFDAYFGDYTTQKTNMKRMRAYIKEMKDYDLRPQLNQLQLPILILSGKYDVQCPHEFSEEMHDILPKAKFVSFLDSNHFPYIEEKASFIHTVDDFFEEL